MKFPIKSNIHLMSELSMDGWQELKTLASASFDVIVDIGAHIGLYSIMARMFHPTKRMLAIEPDKNNYALLVDNVDGLDIETLNMALGDGNPVSLNLSIPKNLCNSLRYTYDAETPDALDTVPSMTIRQIADYTRCDHRRIFWKCDTQGAEEQHVTHTPEAKQLFLEAAGFYLDLDGHPHDQWPHWIPKIESTHTLINHPILKKTGGWIFAVRNI